MVIVTHESYDSVLIIMIIIIRNLYSAIMPLGGYRGAGRTGLGRNGKTERS